MRVADELWDDLNFGLWSDLNFVLVPVWFALRVRVCELMLCPRAKKENFRELKAFRIRLLSGVISIGGRGLELGDL